MTTTATRPAWLAPTLQGYRRAWLAPDIVAGLSAGAVVVPQAMAYATIANLPVQVGLYTCIVPMLVYAMLGGSRAMSVSTTSTIATLTATTLVSAGIAAGAGADDALGSVMMLTLLVGGILLLARVFSLGSLVENISEATVLGVQIGVGATVAVGQLPKLLGETGNASGEGFITSLVAVGGALGSANLPTVVLSVVSILVLVLLKRFAPRVPGALLVVAAGILLVAFTDLADRGVDLIAPVPSGFPAPTLPDPTHIVAMFPGALAIAVMAFLESAAVSRGIRQAADPQIDSNRELLATGAANAVGAFFTTMPSAGGFSQSAVNQSAGAKSQLSSLVTVVLAVLVALFLGPVLSLLPQATLAAMVFVAVVGLIDIRKLVSWWDISRRDFWIALSVAVIGLTAGLLPAVAVGVVVTLALVLREVNTPKLEIVGRRGGALAIHLRRELYTANALPNERAIVELATTQPEPVTAVVLDLERQTLMTITVLGALADLERELAQLHIALHIVRLQHSAAEVAGKTDWFRDLQARGRVHATREAGLAAAAVPAG